MTSLPADTPFGLRKLLPSTCILLAVFLELSRLPLIEFLALPPALSFISIYYWGMVRPARVPMLLLFLLGLAIDSIGLSPFGIHSLLFLGFFWLTRLLRQGLGQLSLSLMWGCFAVWFASFSLVQWAVISFASGVEPPLKDILIYWAITVAAYPLLHLLFDRLLRASQSWPR